MSGTRLFHYIISVKKEDSAFFYFQMEASEGLAFYSTLDRPNNSSESAHYRTIDIKGDIQLHDEFKTLLQSLSRQIFYQVTHYEIIEDRLSHR